jgi:HEAT repeat protein
MEHRMTRNINVGAVLVVLIVAFGLPGCSLRSGGRPPAATGPTPEFVRVTVSQLLRSGADAVDDLDTDRVDATVAQLAALGEPAIAPLTAALSDPDENVRVVAVQALAKLNTPKSVEPLLTALADESPQVRVETAIGLGQLRDRRAAQPLLQQYLKDDAYQVRVQCLRSLKLIGDPQIIAQLHTGARAADPSLRAASITALCHMQDEQAPDLALTHARDADVDVRKQVLAECEQALDSAQGHQLLIDLALSADDLQTGMLARRDLSHYRLQPGGADELTEQMRRAGIDGLTRPTQAVNAALLLGDLGDPAALDVLITSLQSPDGLLRFLAVSELRDSGDRRAVPALIKTLGDPLGSVRCTAYRALKKFASDGDARAKEAILAYKKTDCEPPLGL